MTIFKKILTVHTLLFKTDALKLNKMKIFHEMRIKNFIKLKKKSYPTILYCVNTDALQLDIKDEFSQKGTGFLHLFCFNALPDFFFSKFVANLSALWTTVAL